ncbi:fimbria/pilus outer membrane usher protein [Pseudomonas nitroreducens]|uniref:fimbria/pilus outer membrane usher protein n=1 Tax=Pseudomonas TaxID=286 RepID=UPI000C1FC06A|nr:fimbria/pilus outer membrane usher protein [Pseudomonas nitroreducens]
MNYFTRLSLFFVSCLASSCWGDVKSIHVMVNDTYKGRLDIELDNDLDICVSMGLLQQLKVRQTTAKSSELTEDGCLTASALQRRNIRKSYDESTQLLRIMLPGSQVDDGNNEPDTRRWDNGVTAGFIDYRLNYARYGGSQYADADRQASLYADLNTGFNLDAWRIRYEPVYQQETWGKAQWYTERALAYRDIPDWRSQLSVGDGATASTLFNSIRFRGASLASDERMLPNRLRGTFPWIRGYAHSNAEVKVRQNGEVIYQTFVSPGSFVLKDVYPPDPSGDIETTIKESDGTESVRRVPYSVMPNLVHDRQWKYDVTAGKVRPYHGIEQVEPTFYRIGVGYGLPSNLTLFGGFLAADIYRSAALGIGRSLGEWGTLSVDYSLSSAEDPRRTENDRGGMARLRYAKAFPALESSLNVLAQYYPDQRYRTFGQTVSQQQTYWWDWEEGVFVGEFDAEKKYRLEASYNQYFSESDSLYLTVVREAMRGKDKGETSLEFGYSATWGDVDVSLYAEYTDSLFNQAQSQVGVSFSIPLGAVGVPRMKFNLDETLAHNDSGSRRAGVSGTLFSDFSLSYDASASQNQRSGEGQDVSLDYQYNAGELRVGYSRGDGYRMQTGELSGSVVAHSGGITLGQSLGETMAIVNVADSPGIGVDNQYGVTTDRWGNAIVTTLTPYRPNRLTLGTFSLPDATHLAESEAEVVPTAGAIVFTRFPAARRGDGMLATTAPEVARPAAPAPQALPLPATDGSADSSARTSMAQSDAVKGDLVFTRFPSHPVNAATATRRFSSSR